MSKLDFNIYQKFARETAIYPQLRGNFTYPVLGLCGESGEVAEKVKKIIRDDAGQISELKRQEIKKELGDVLWYLANVCYEFNLTLEEVANANLDKLKKRQQENKLHGNGDNR